jgi:hypothetical protein
MPPPNDQVPIGTTVARTAKGSKAPSNWAANTEALLRLGALLVLGTIAVILCIGAVDIWKSNTQNAKDYWIIAGPIVSAIAAGIVGFVTGRADRR